MLRLDYVEYHAADGLSPSVCMWLASVVLYISDGNIFAFHEHINQDINYVNMYIDLSLSKDKFKYNAMFPSISISDVSHMLSIHGV